MLMRYIAVFLIATGISMILFGILFAPFSEEDLILKFSIGKESFAIINMNGSKVNVSGIGVGVRNSKAIVMKTGFSPMFEPDIKIIGIIYNNPSVILLKFSNVSKAEDILVAITNNNSSHPITVTMDGKEVKDVRIFAKKFGYDKIYIYILTNSFNKDVEEVELKGEISNFKFNISFEPMWNSH